MKRPFSDSAFFYGFSSLLALSLLLQSAAAQDLSGEIQVLRRGDLPSDFDFPIVQLDFAVVRVVLENNGSEAVRIQPDSVRFQEPRGRYMERARPPEITPEIMKTPQMRHSNRTTHGDVHVGHPDYGRHHPVVRGTHIPGSTGGSAGAVHVDTAPRIRGILEEHELKETVLEPGERIEALLYFKSRRTPAQLSGSRLSLGEFEFVVP